MVNITKNELDIILENHKKWLNDELDGERADLSKMNLRRANLSKMNLRRANLSGADLSKADLYMANLSGADLSKADLSRADLREADLYIPIACPEKGAFTAFKKAYGEHIVELLIPEDALRLSATSRKCRCSKAKVISITNVDGTDSGLITVNSTYDNNFIYAIGEIVEEPNFNLDRWNECSEGIHFFITRQEAIDY